MSRTMSKNELERILSAATFEKIEVAKIKPAPYNPRADLQPGDEDYERIRKSLIDHTLMQPLVFNKRTGHAVGGNQRLKVLQNEGIKQVTCAIIDVNLQREKEINLALNKINNMWDQPKLRDLFLEMQQKGRDLTRTGFRDYDIAKLTQDYGANLGSFFEDDDEPAKHDKKVHTYKCPYCGEVFQK